MLGAQGNPASLKITQVSNGFVVNIGDYGYSEIKEPYTKETKIFSTFEDMNKFLLSFFGGPDQFKVNT